MILRASSRAESAQLPRSGYVPAQPNCIAAIRLARRETGGLVYAGKAGTGFTTAQDKRLEPLMRRTPPTAKPLRKKDTVWVEPKLSARIEDRGVTEDGMPRHPSFKGMVSGDQAGDLRMRMFRRTRRSQHSRQKPIGVRWCTEIGRCVCDLEAKRGFRQEIYPADAALPRNPGDPALVNCGRALRLKLPPSMSYSMVLLPGRSQLLRRDGHHLVSPGILCRFTRPRARRPRLDRGRRQPLSS
jgi:hypothetical protein